MRSNKILQLFYVSILQTKKVYCLTYQEKRLRIHSKSRRIFLFYPLFSLTLLLYLCFASQMVLLGFYHDPSIFTSPMTSIHAGAQYNRHCERVHLAGVPKRIGAL